MVVTATGGSTSFQLVHEDDVARAVTVLARHPGEGAYNLAADGLLETETAARKVGAKLITLPLWVLRILIWVGWILGIKSISEAPPGLLNYFVHSWQVDNKRLKEEAGFTYEYDAESTFEDFLRAKNLA